MNPVTGEKLIDICGQKFVIRFDWRALAEVEKRFGDKPNLLQPEIVAAVAEAGLRARHPDMTAARIIELSPPLVPFAHSVQQAFQWAYFGPEPAPSEEEVSKKKSSPPQGAGFLRRTVRRLLAVYGLKSSGA